MKQIQENCAILIKISAALLSDSGGSMYFGNLRMIMKWISFLLLLVVLLTSCEAKASQVPPTFSPVPSSTPQATNTSTSTSTPNRTQTATATFTATLPPYMVDLYMAKTATAVAEEKYIREFQIDCDLLAVDRSLFSPDKNWLATGCYASDNVLIVANRDGSKIWHVPAGHMPGVDDGNLGNTQYCLGDPIYWSRDSQYVYFFLYYCIEPDLIGDYSIDMNPMSRSLYRMNTQTGNYYEFTPKANSFNFSSSGDHLFCITRFNGDNNEFASVKLTLINTKNNQREEFWLGYTLAAADVVWSQDDSRIFFVVDKGKPWEIFTRRQNSNTWTNHLAIYEIDLQEKSITRLLDFPEIEGVIYPVSIDESSNSLVLTRVMYANRDVQVTLILDLSTDQLVTTENTPVP